ncbi:MAG: GIY-YIG nuclease family protein [Desulfuromonadales bacterium]|nr:GIY-YIG nuclease family protein [Desulfuromonadales bacterium]
MTPESFSVRIFLQDGHVDGVKIIAKSKWSGRALVIPRSSLAEEIDRKELNAPGVYILVGPSVEGDLPTIHIGAADHICHDLSRHDIQKDFWNWVVAFASKDDSLNLAHMQYFASRLKQLAQEARRAKLDNLNDPQFAELATTESANTESFLEHMLSICPLLGLPVFEKPKRVSQSEASRGSL